MKITKKILSILFLSILVFVSAASAQKERKISEVQGDKNVSLYANEIVRISGIVTARTKTGFFLQTPDAQVDANPNTSEGIFVYTRTEPTVEATIGNLVSVSGEVGVAIAMEKNPTIFA